MARFTKFIVIGLAAIAIAALTSACGTQTIGPTRVDAHYTADTAAAKLFNQRCGGCHTLAAAGTFGSGQNPRDYLNISGPNFDSRCERPYTRVLYAIENGGFSGAYMPQNIVTGEQAKEVALFVARFSGRSAPFSPGTLSCSQKSVTPTAKSRPSAG